MIEPKKINATDMARKSSDIIVMAQQGQSFEVQKHGKPIAYVISPEDYTILEEINNQGTQSGEQENGYEGKASSKQY